MTTSPLAVLDTSSKRIFLLLTVFLSSIPLKYSGIVNELSTQKVYQSESELFTTLVEYVSSKGLYHDEPKQLKLSLRVDPHIMSIGYSHQEKLKKQDLSTSPKQLAERQNILENKKIPLANAIKEQECIYYGGLGDPENLNEQNMPKSQIPQHCKDLGFFITIIFGQPQPTADANCTTSENSDLNSQCWKIDALELTSSSKNVYSLYLSNQPPKGWVIKRKELIGGVFF